MTAHSLGFDVPHNEITCTCGRTFEYRTRPAAKAMDEAREHRYYEKRYGPMKARRLEIVAETQRTTRELAERFGITPGGANRWLWRHAVVVRDSVWRGSRKRQADRWTLRVPLDGKAVSA